MILTEQLLLEAIFRALTMVVDDANKFNGNISDVTQTHVNNTLTAMAREYPQEILLKK